MAVLAQDIPQFTALDSVKTPRVMRTVFLILLFGFIATVGFLIYVPWVQTTSGQGVVTTLNPNERQQELNALVSGRIEEFYVRDGSQVKKGDPIARIADIDPQLVERLEAERQQVEIQLQAARNALATAEIDERRMAELFREGLAARRDYEQAQIRVEQLRGSVAEAQANLTRTQTSLSRQSSQLVTAPRDGFIQSVNAGDVATIVNAGDVLVTFVPQSAERVIEIFVDGRDVGLVQVGDKARVQFEGWPVVQFSGWPSVAVGTFGGIVTAVDQSAQADGRFRVLISEDKSDPHAWPKERYARFGASVRAWILLETVPVGYEIWRQLNNFPPELPAGAEPAGTSA
ncbi:RND family efflux transporter, MFP subunit [Erythrobacter litoralis]|jgi:RND family efflux transporter MFP subunit|uniref:RND transporter n=1 Tax=Erythrobacter litoralis TaxID=39960 RepID=A0A074MDH1_9SPHN|nr:HlyD family efflux transporter periplasmic adaptor subunit [Erythrobacter litoralis]AOL22823.1 RND family efflux transporter, MFP subunit [Erythrobacter litoralis]KEO92876.1 RND transporter [Erythrobacter litoralis]MEE4338670.1 HlyD family efflux transporter periplasmic adaptor subunit [Erythrobacter sp.]